MKLIIGIAKAIRDAWIVFGVALALVVGSEVFYRMLLEDKEFAFDLPNPMAIVGATRGPRGGPPHPYQDTAWYAPWLKAREGAYINGNVTYDPYRGWWPRTVAHVGLHVDAAGIRRTVQPALRDDQEKRSVYLFGGSTMWGFSARDHATIPSLLAARLAEAGIHDVEIVNFAQIAFNLTQNLATLSLRLREGEQPVAAIFLDGVNEIAPIDAGERPGNIWHQTIAAERFERGRRRSGSSAVADLASTFRIIRPIVYRREQARELPPLEIDSSCEWVATSYVNLFRIGGALGREFDVDTLFFWQPTLATSQKRRGPWESWLMSKEVRASSQRLVAMIRECASRVTQKLEPWRGTRFFPLHHVFDQEQSDVFLDHFGHITEDANRVIAEEIAQRLLPVLDRVDRPETAKSGDHEQGFREHESFRSRRQSGGEG